MRYRIAYSSKKEDCTVYIVSSVREPGAKSPRTLIHKSFGKRSVLLARDPRALDKIKAEVEQLNSEALSKAEELSRKAFESFLNEAKNNLQLEAPEKNAVFAQRSLGLIVLFSVYEELALSAKSNYLRHRSHIQYDLSAIVRDLVLLRLLSPASKLRSSIRGVQDYLGFQSVNVDYMYRALDVLADNKATIVKYLNLQLGKCIKERDTSVCLYDITTYAFESTHQDDLRDFGYSKDKKFNEVQVVMALAADRNGIPLDYSLYRGNQAESATMIPFVERLKKQFKVEKFIVVADRGLNNKSNIDALVKLGNDYVLSSKIRTAGKAIKDLVLDSQGRQTWSRADSDGLVIDNGWFKEIEIAEEFEYRFPNYAFEDKGQRQEEQLLQKLKHKTTKSGRTVKSALKRRYIVTWSASRAAKDRIDRERLLKKAQTLVEHPCLIKSSFKRGGRGFVDINLDSSSARIDTKLIKEQEKFDGIHVIETSLNNPASEVIEIYAGLWKIEDNFRNLKGQLDARPIYVRLPDHIRGHFLICYLALTLLRYLQYKLDKAGTHATSDEIIRALNRVQVALIRPSDACEFYAVDGVDQVMKNIFEVCNLKVPNTYESGINLRKNYIRTCL